jgi:hypothetical protein
MQSFWILVGMWVTILLVVGTVSCARRNGWAKMPRMTRRRRRPVQTGQSSWQWLGTSCLILAGAAVTVAAPIYAPKAGAIFSSPEAIVAYWLVAFGFMCFVGALLGRPFPPWARVRFPDLEIELLRIRTFPDGSNNLWNVVRLTITNCEINRPSNITIRYIVAMDADFKIGTTHYDEAPAKQPRDEPTGGVPPEAELLRVPVTLLPQTTIGGSYLTELPNWIRKGAKFPLDEML